MAIGGPDSNIDQFCWRNGDCPAPRVQTPDVDGEGGGLSGNIPE